MSAYTPMIITINIKRIFLVFLFRYLQVEGMNYLLSWKVIWEPDLGSEPAGTEFSLPGDVLYVDPASYTCWSGFETAGTAW